MSNSEIRYIQDQAGNWQILQEQYATDMEQLLAKGVGPSDPLLISAFARVDSCRLTSLNYANEARELVWLGE